MKIKQLRISTQLSIGLAVLLLLAIVQGAVSYIQSDRINQQTEDIYNHPLLVRRAIGELKSDILLIQRNLKDICIVGNKDGIDSDLNQIEMYKSIASEQLSILKSLYLGPRSDIDTLNQNFILWSSIREETIRLFKDGKNKEASVRVSSAGIRKREAEKVLKALEKIDIFASHKADELYSRSNQLNDSLNNMLIIFGVVNIFVALLFYFILLGNIRKPLADLSGTLKRFQDGDLNARSSFESNNSIGVLSSSFNSLAQSIQENLEIKEKITDLTGVMLREDDPRRFFRALLTALAADTGSQMAAVYLLSGDKKSFNYFESVGLDDSAQITFSAEHFEGEFGSAVSSGKIKHIKNIPEDSRFVFNTVNGKFLPREIITIPLLSGKSVIAVISIAGINCYSRQTLQLVDNIFILLGTRVEGILANVALKEFSEQLAKQNRELDAQKTELAAQSSELAEQNRELEMQKNQLEEASRLKTNFLSNMSHELRTPLNSVIALSGVLNRRLADKIPADEYSYLEIIERNGKNLLSLINDILDISRIEAGREEIELTKFNANSIASEVVSMIKPQALEKNIDLLLLTSDSDFIVSSDSHKFRHILQNLISNAVKFTEKGKVEIIASTNGGNINVSIKDTGIGISADQLPHIFDEFRQADSSTSRRFGGTGLGLAIAKKYAILLGGNISVKSIPGKGSEFILTLPMIINSINGMISTEPLSGFRNVVRHPVLKPSTDSTVKTILLVEDSEPAIIQIKDFLEESGYNIWVARDGNEALSITGKTIPDAIILDLMMPGVDGFTVLKTIRESDRTEHIPVLILTAKQITKEDLRFLKHNNIHQLIQKGDVSRIDLMNAVASMVYSQPEEMIIPQKELQTIEGKPVVLVVEDNPDNMTTVKALLADNFKVIEAVNGMEGLELARKHKPNLILMDIAIPLMDGIETFRRIRVLPELQHVPIIALTASAMTNDRETILAYGFDAYISKPIDEHLFSMTINETLYGK